MSLWEYKIITSGKGGFARPDLLEKFLNDLGRDEWEIIEFHSAPDNFLVFTGLARRSTQRDWTLEDAAAAAAKAEAEKLRAEFEAKFKAATAPVPEERPAEFLQEKVAPDDGFRKPVDTSHDADPDADEDEKDEWDELAAAEDDELPTFFEAIKPHMRRNQRGPGMSVGVDYLAKKWDQSEDDLKNALIECGFTVPEDEDAKAEYLEYDGDLYWLNVNRRGELWINTKEKPRPVFKPVKAQKVAIEEEPRKGEERGRKAAEEAAKAEAETAKAEAEPKPETPQPETAAADAGEAAPAEENAGKRQSKPEAAPAELPQGPALLKKIRPHMRRNRRGPGGSGSASFLSRALKTNEDELKAAFVALGLKVPASSNEKPTYLEVGNEVWWLNADSRGGLWINGREKRAGETIAAPEAAEATTEAEAPVLTGEPAPAAEATPAGAPQEISSEAQPVAAASGAEQTSLSLNTPAVMPPAASATVPVPEQQPLHPAAPTAVTETAAPVAPVLTDAAATPREPEPAIEPSPLVVREPAVVPALDIAPESAASAVPMPEPAPSPQPVAAESNATPTDASLLARLRPLLKEAKGGLSAARVDRVAEETGQSPADLVAALISAGLKVPEKPREKPVSVEHAGERVWLTRNGRGELWLNAKPSKLADPRDDEEEGELDPAGEDDEPDADKKARRSRSRRKPESEGSTPKPE